MTQCGRCHSACPTLAGTLGALASIEVLKRSLVSYLNISAGYYLSMLINGLELRAILKEVALAKMDAHRPRPELQNQEP
jgi:ferredoxin